MRLSVAVMAHPARADLVETLIDRLGIGPERVVWDSGNNNRWDTGRRAWEAHDRHATHHLVIQDDAVVCLDLIAGLEGALTHVPADAIVSPYVGTRRPMPEKIERYVAEAQMSGSSWIIMRALNWGVGICAPIPTIPNMLVWCDRQGYPNYDRRVGRYYLDRLRWPTWCTMPSLVDHLPVPSLCGHGGGRSAHAFLGETRSALTVDWGAGHVEMSRPAPRPQSAAQRRRVARKAAMAVPPVERVRWRSTSNGRTVVVVAGSDRDIRFRLLPERWIREEVSC